MPMSDAQNKADRHYRLLKLFEQPGQHLRTSEIAARLGTSDDTVKRDIDELSLNGRLPLRKQGHYWIVAEEAHLEHLQVRLNVAEAAALYVAARLLSQIHDERNRHVILALTKLIDALPEPLRPYQYALVEMAERRQQDQAEQSEIFQTLALGWAKHLKVRLFYAPPHKRTFECLFSPYLLEPSGIGRTIYILGESTPPGSLRTYKLERIEHATLTEEPFEVREDFDAPTLLARAWGVMYGDEDLVEVRLRFSHWVTKRLKETLWHPSQRITDTSKGCEWSASIGDLTEIRPWIRGWGADCEVLAPAELREELMGEIMRSARLYGLNVHQASTDGEPDMDLLNSFFGDEAE